MIRREELNWLHGREVRDRNGTKVGTVGQIWGDAALGVPAWASVRTGLFGSSESLVPLRDATLDGDQIRCRSTSPGSRTPRPWTRRQTMP